MDRNNNKPINILWIVDHLGYDGIMHGAGKYYLNTIPNFDNSKYRITLCVVRDKDQLTKLYNDSGVPVTHFHRGKYDPRTIYDLIKTIKKYNIKLIHSHGYGADNFGRFVSKLCGIPSIIHAHDDNSNYPLHQKIADIILIPFTKKAIAISQAVLDSCIAIRNISRKKLTVLNNGILLDRFIPTEKGNHQKVREKFGIDSNVKVIGTAARLRKEKGVRYLIEAAPNILKQFPNTVFLIAGDGPLRNELEELAKKLNVSDKIIFAGFCIDIPSILSIIDIFVAPSVSEGLGLGILEAMSMSKPIVASNVGGIKEILVDNKTGLLVPSENSELLADKVNYLLKNEKEANLLGMNAREESKKYDNNVHIEKLENIYSELLKKND